MCKCARFHLILVLKTKVSGEYGANAGWNTSREPSIRVWKLFEPAFVLRLSKARDLAQTEFLFGACKILLPKKEGYAK